MNIENKVINLAMAVGNKVISRFDGGEKRPVVFNTYETFPELLIFEEHYDSVKAEFENVIQHSKIPAYHEIEQRQYAISGKIAPHVKWKVFMLHYSGETPEIAKALCPHICDLVKNSPNIYKVFFSILEPGKSIPAHRGPYRGYLRYHLGLKVPKSNPPKLRIKDALYTWKEKESILFDDTWEHEVLNTAEETRAVLIIDLLRPLPFLPDQLNKFITKVILKKIRIKKVLKDVEKFNQNQILKT